VANTPTFRRLRRDPSSGSTPLIFNSSGGNAGQLQAVINIGGLYASGLGDSRLAASVRMGGMEAVECGAALLAAVVRLGGMRVGDCGFGELDALVLPYMSESAAWDINVPSGPGARITADFGRGMQAARSMAIVRRASLPMADSHVFAMAPGNTRLASAIFRIAGFKRLAQDLIIKLGVSNAFYARLESPFAAHLARLTDNIDIRLATLHQAQAHDVLAFWLPPRKTSHCVFPFGAAVQRTASIWMGLLDGRQLTARCVFPLIWGHRLYAGASPRPPLPPPPPPHYIVDLIFRFKWDGGNSLIFNRRLSLTIQRTYYVSNTFDLYRLPDHAPIPATAVTLNTDADSWCWSFQGALASLAAAQLLIPTSEIQPAEVRAIINGVAWEFLVDDPQAFEDAGGHRGQARGRSLSAYLDEPYAMISTFANAEDRTIQQIIGDVLPQDTLGNPTPVTFDIEDWLVPAGAWSFQGSPQKAVARIAEAIGAILQADKAGIGLSLAKRYPVLPWAWADAAPDHTIPRNVWVSRERKWVNHPPYDSVSIAGEVAGLLATVKRDGSAGNRPAPSVTDRLVVNAISARQRGESILGNTGLQTLETIVMPVIEPVGLVAMGALLEFVDVETWRGLVRSVSVSANLQSGALEVYQTLEVERHHG
jgi:hypothetical protein